MLGSIFLGGKLPRLERRVPMSEKQLREFLETIKQVQETHASTPADARKMLVQAGFYTEAGELTEHYRPVDIKS